MARLIFPEEATQASRCQHYGVCGGCRAQHLRYADQLEIKARYIDTFFTDRFAADQSECLPIIPAPAELFYRNKVEFTFSDRAYLTKEQIASGESFEGGALGFHAPRFFAKAVDVEECLLHLPIINDLRNTIRQFAKAQGYSFYNPKKHIGLLRNLVFRSNQAGEIMLILVLGEDTPEVADAIFQHLDEAYPNTLASRWWILNTRKNSSTQDLAPTHHSGAKVLTEQLGACTFTIHPQAFFQTNSAQAEVLYNVVADFLKQALSAPVQTLYDLYCGAGSIGIYCHESAQNIVGIEYVKEAIVDAQHNAKENGLDKARYHVGDIQKMLNAQFFAEHGSPDAIVVDPPRAGLGEKVAKVIAATCAPVIVYVSCNPETQASDLAAMPEYRVLKAQAVDMFPQTPHVEQVLLLTRR